MKITVLYFAQLAELAGKHEEVREIDHDSPAQLFTALKEAYQFPQKFEDVQIAINHELSAHARTLNEGDEIAFLPPMSGG